MTLADVIAFIATATDAEIERIVDAITERPVGELVEPAPGWEERAMARFRALRPKDS